MARQKYTSYKARSRRIRSDRDPDYRAERAKTFRATYAALGLKLPEVAQLLHVSPRTLHNWNAGKYDIPYAAFKLLRVLLHYELPDPAWKGWHFAQGRLWTPEGHSIAAHESSWWSLMVRMARQYLAASTRCRDLERQLGAQGLPETRPVTRSGGGSGAGKPGALAPAQGPARSAGP